MNPMLIVSGALCLLVVLWVKGYLGIADLFGLAATAKPSNLLAKQSSSEVFAKAVKLAMEEAHDEVASKMADTMRRQVVQTHMSAFSAAGPSAQPAPDASTSAAPIAS